MPEQEPETEREIAEKRALARAEQHEHESKIEHDREVALAMAHDRERGGVSISGLTRPEAREFGRLFVISFIVFVVIAIVAHYLVWIWRPWLQMGIPTSQTGLLEPLLPLLSVFG